MRMLIVRGYGSIMNIGNYNTQEIGLAKAFIKAGIETDIVFYGGKEPSHIQKWPIDGEKSISIYWLKGKEYLKHGVMPEVYELANNYDYLWLDEYNQYISYKLAKLYPEKSYIYHGPYTQNYSVLRRVMDEICSTIFFDKKVADNVQVFTKSQLAKKSLKKRGFKKIETLGVGLDTSRFRNFDAVDLNSIGMNPSDKFLLYIGSIDERRNTLFLLEVFHKLCIRNKEYKLLLIGKAKDKYWKKCISLIKRYDLESKVVHVEKMPQDHLPDIYKSATAFLFPTRYDIFGMVLMEAMYFGVPIISSINGGSTTLIQSGENGFVCDLKYDSWIQATQEVISNDILRDKLGKAAQETIRAYSWECIVEHAMKFMKGI